MPIPSPAPLLCLATLLAAAPACAGAKPAAATDRATVESAARELIAGARYGTLITLGPDGHPQARTVENLPPESDFTVWFATNPRTRKVDEIRRDPRVTLHWFDPGRLGYVALVGTAAFVTDSAERARRWQPGWAAFYPDRGRDYLLVRVTPLRLEVVSPSHGIIGDSLTWRPPVLTFPPAPARP